VITSKTLHAPASHILYQKPVLKAFLKPLWPYLNIKNLVELNVNREKELRLEVANEKTRFVKAEELDLKYWKNLCHVLANGSGLAFDIEKQPRVSVELPGGHRFEAMVGNHSKKTISVSIRIKRNMELNIESFGLTGSTKEKIIRFVRNGANMVISGGTSSGKTTFLNTLVRYIPAETRILTVEDTYELDIPHHDQINYVVSRNETTPTIGYSQMIDHLVRSRPDVIIAGEVSVSNSFPIIRMLNSGHSGFMCTVHANTPELALGSAIPQNIVMAGIQVPNIEKILYELIDVVIQLHRNKEGERVVTDILYPKLKEREALNAECTIN
jgi:Flp pilus assembly CpaF family ATPase